MKTSPIKKIKSAAVYSMIGASSILGFGGCASQKGLQPGTEVFSVGDVYVGKNLEGKIGEDGERTFYKINTYSVKKDSNGEKKLRNNLPKRVLERGGNTTILGKSKFPKIADKQKELYDNAPIKPEEKKGSHWYNQGIFGNKYFRTIGGAFAVAGIGYGISRLNDKDSKKGDNSLPEDPADVGISGGREDPISDSGSVRGGRGSGNDQSGGNR